MNSLPGPMGYGWMLNCGGVITRSLNGKYDEHIPNGINNPSNYFHCYDTIEELMASPENDYQLLKSASLSLYDMQPDVFYFNFMGMTGRFFLGNDGEWKVLSEHNIDVEHQIYGDEYFGYPLFTYSPGWQTSSTQPKVIKMFRLRDDKGNIYEFGNGNAIYGAIDYSIGIFGMQEGDTSASWNSDAWYLTKVSDRLGNVLYEFHYYRGKYIAQVLNSFEAVRVNNTTEFWGGLSSTVGGSNVNFPYQITINSPVYLSSVTCANGATLNLSIDTIPIGSQALYQNFYSKFPGGSIPGDAGGLYGENLLYYYLQTDQQTAAYYQQPNNRKLTNPLASTRPMYYTNIRITDVDGTAKKEYRPVYSYEGRMHLTGIDIYGNFWYSGQLSRITGYTFGYDRYSLLPCDCTTTAVDHWGYYNGNGYTLPDSYSVNYFNSFKSTRNTNAEKVLYGSLTSIVYPTGGKTVITYEPHEYSQCLSNDRQTLLSTSGVAGGLRVKSIKLYEDEGCQKCIDSHVYEYKKGNGTSSGILAADPIYYWTNWAGNTAGGQSSTSTVTLFRVCSIIPLSNSFGSHVAYSLVKDTRADGSCVVTEFTSHEDYKDQGFIIDFNDSRPSPFDRFYETGFKRGKPTRETAFDASGGIVRQTTYTYEEKDCTGTTYGCNVYGLGNVGYASCDVYTGGVYRLRSPKWTLCEMRDSSVIDGGITSVTAYGTEARLIRMTSPYIHYAQALFPESETISRGNQSMTVEYKYYTGTGFSANSLIIPQYFTLSPSSVKKSMDGLEVETDSTALSLFMVNGSLRPLAIHELKLIGEAVKDTLVKYIEYTETGRPSAIIDRNNQLTRLVWGYNDTYLMAKCVGSGTIADAPSYTPDDAFYRNNVINMFSQFRADNPQWLITSYTYSPNYGVTSITAPNGNTTYFDYDRAFRLWRITDHNRNIIKQYDYEYAR